MTNLAGLLLCKTGAKLEPNDIKGLFSYSLMKSLCESHFWDRSWDSRESFLSYLEEIAKKCGITKILVSGASGAINNYQMTINHVSTLFIVGQDPVVLKNEFRFNAIDLTRRCYVARHF